MAVKPISKPLKKLPKEHDGTMCGDPSIHDINEMLVIREPVDKDTTVVGRDPSTDLVVTYQNEEAKKHTYNKESNAKTVFIQENGIVIYSF